MAITIPEIIGLPPDDKKMPIESNLIYNSMPIAQITPCEANFIMGLATFRITPTSKYQNLLNSHGYATHNSRYLKISFLADSFPTDNFQNTYSESFLQNISNGISQGASTLMQTLGARTGTEGFKKMMDAGGTIMDEIGVGGDMLRKTGSMATKAAKAIGNHVSDDGVMGRLMNGLNSTLGGSRFDFPMIWTDSSFQPSYTMTVRLYNPDPASLEATKKYIIGPIAALLLLGLPLSDDNKGSTYNYPFLHKIKCPGIYFLNPCFISNISVIKGGDQQQIAYNQRLSIVDVRLDFGSLFSSMLASKYTNDKRPTLKSYLKVMEEGKDLHNTDDDDLYIDQAPAGGILYDKQSSVVTGKKSEYLSNVEYNMMKSYIEAKGSLSKVIESGIPVTKTMVEELYNNNVITSEEYYNYQQT